MGIFRRDRGAAEPAKQAEAIADFWRWWGDEGAALAVASITAGAHDRFVREISPRVRRIEKDLAWELAEGQLAEHLLVVSAEGNTTLRPVARRWLRAAPPGDGTWEYADSRQPVLDLNEVQLEVGGAAVALGEVVVAMQRDGARVDVVAHHPSFVDLSEEVRTQITFLALDAALGEDDVETWVGQVTTTPIEPLDPVPLAGLRAAVRDLREDYTTETGEPAWVLLKGEGPGGPVMASAQVPLISVAAPHLDTHVAVMVPYSDVTEEGFPGPGSLDALRALEDHLADRLGDSARIVAHQSHGGLRVLHVYVDSTTPAVEQLTAAVSGWDQGPVEVSATTDPGWQHVEHLRT